MKIVAQSVELFNENERSVKIVSPTSHDNEVHQKAQLNQVFDSWKYC